jgi:hypothetical protein
MKVLVLGRDNEVAYVFPNEAEAHANLHRL